MKPSEFTSFKDAMPDEHKHIIVTNNINATDAHGEMSNVWMTTVLYFHPDGEISSFNYGNAKLSFLTHWKYA
jgi:hypothetical protein